MIVCDNERKINKNMNITKMVGKRPTLRSTRRERRQDDVVIVVFRYRRESAEMRVVAICQGCGINIALNAIN